MLPGDHITYVTDAALHKQLSAVFGADNLGHSVLTVAPQRVAPAAGGEGELQVLVTRDDTPMLGYDIVIADPDGAIAERLGLKHGGRVVVRPDGYIGAISTLDDTKAVSNYFARLAS